MADTGEAQGRPEAPRRGEPAADAADDMDFKPKRSKAVLLAVLFAVALGAVGIGIALTRPTREPLKVLIAIDAQGVWYDGSKTSAHLLENVVPHLKTLGFDAVDGSDADTAKVLKGAKSVDDAAKRVHASLIVTGKLKIDVSEVGNGVGMFEVRVAGPIQLRQYDGAPRELGEIHTWSGATDKDMALALAARNLGWQVFDELLPGLMLHPSVRAILEGDDKIAAAKLSAATAYLVKRDKQLEFARSSYASLAQKFAAGDASPTKVTLHSPLDRQDGLCATGVAGAFVLSSPIRPFFRPVEQELGYFIELERLFWQGTDGKQRTVFEGFNVRGYPSATPDGTAAVYVEDLYDAATALDLVRGTSAARRVYVDSKLRLSEPKIASGGVLAAAWGRLCPRCPAMVVVVDLESGAVAYRSDPAKAKLGGFVWLGPKRLGVLTRSTEQAAPGSDAPPVATDAAGDEDDGTEDQGPSQTFTAWDFSVTPPTSAVLGSVSGAARLALPSASADGRRVVFSRRADDGMHLALYDDSTHGLEPLPVEHARDPALSPDGNKIGFIRRGEIEIYDLAKRTADPLTKTSDEFALRYPQFSLDGRRVYFEVRTKDPVFPTERSVSAVASVAVP